MIAVTTGPSPRKWQRIAGGALMVAGLAVGVSIITLSGTDSPHVWVEAGAGALLAAAIPVGVGVKMLRLPRRLGYLIGLTVGWLPGVAVAFDAVDSMVEPSLWLSTGLRGNHTIGQVRSDGVAGLVVAAMFIAVWAAAFYVYRHPSQPTARLRPERKRPTRRGKP